MIRAVPLYTLLYALVAGGLIGLALGTLGFGRGGTPLAPAHGGEMAEMHAHGRFNVESGPIPTLSLSVTPDPESGWNIRLETENFTFRPPSFAPEISANAGHAHLYINGEKHSRLYGRDVHVTGLAPGVNEVRVTLNTDDHQELYVEGEVISAGAFLSF